jgi:hypothetical protein
MAAEAPELDGVEELATDDQRFANAVRAAVEASGLGLERIQRRLRDRGAHVSIATLSYWQSGRSKPRRRASFEALAQLETVLGLAPGALERLLPARDAGATGGDSIGTLSAVLGDDVEMPARFAELDARLRRSLELVSEHIKIDIGPDRAHHTLWSRRIIRAAADGVDRFILADHSHDEGAHPPTIVPLTHCSVGERHVVPESDGVLTELRFDRSLAKGESIMIEYRLEYGPPRPMDTFREVQRQHPVREFVMEVGFHPPARPQACEWYEFSAEEPARIDRLRALDLNSTDSVLVVRHDLPAIRYGVRWTWD